MESLAQTAPVVMAPALPALDGDVPSPFGPRELNDLFFPDNDEEVEEEVSALLPLECGRRSPSSWAMLPESLLSFTHPPPPRMLVPYGNGRIPATAFTCFPPLGVRRGLEGRESAQVD